jgi:hypothetical protein
MRPRENSLIQVVDAHVKWLADESRTSGTETRISIFTFNSGVECLIFDMDVLRYKTIRGSYRTGGNTALLSAFLKSQDHLDKLENAYGSYGEHNFFTVIFTDGAENWSQHIEHLTPNQLADKVKRRIQGLGENRTVACMVPDARGQTNAVNWGIPQGNVAIWNADSATGVEEAGMTLRGATQTLLDNYSTGARNSRAVFAGGVAQVNADTINASGLKPLDPSKFLLIPVANPGGRLTEYVKKRDIRKRKAVMISDFVETTGRRYVVGKTFYQLGHLSDRVQANKLIAVVDNVTNKVYLGEAARKLLNLPNERVTLKKDPNSRYDIYIASHSTNRYLEIGSQILLLN